jgi:hypothetical protein
LGLSLQSLEPIGHDGTQLIDLGLQFIRCHGDDPLSYSLIDPRCPRVCVKTLICRRGRHC